MTTKNTTYKNWMTVGLVAGVLALSACSKDETPMETQADTSVDAQTSVEENATATSSDDTLRPCFSIWQKSQSAGAMPAMGVLGS